MKLKTRENIVFNYIGPILRWAIKFCATKLGVYPKLDYNEHDVISKIGKTLRQFLNAKDIQNTLHIDLSAIYCIENQVFIVTSTPGLWIGRRGTNIELLENELEKKIRIIENPSFNLSSGLRLYLNSRDEMEYEYDFD